MSTDMAQLATEFQTGKLMPYGMPRGNVHLGVTERVKPDGDE